ncbi:MAG: hypothetical protein ACJ780_15420 [Solirubrobacteraceae bacterium]
MKWCCPRGHGCNAPNGGEPCALEVCRLITNWQSDASLALARWREFERASEQGCSESERRFRRRAFQRARDRALIAQAMQALPSAPCDQPRAAMTPTADGSAGRTLATTRTRGPPRKTPGATLRDGARR